ESRSSSLEYGLKFNAINIGPDSRLELDAFNCLYEYRRSAFDTRRSPKERNCHQDSHRCRSSAYHSPAINRKLAPVSRRRSCRAAASVLGFEACSGGRVSPAPASGRTLTRFSSFVFRSGLLPSDWFALWPDASP